VVLVANATMYLSTDFAGSGCSGTATATEWKAAGVCMDLTSQGMGHMKFTCSGANTVATGYSDAACTTVNTSFSLPGLTMTAGVFDPQSSCFSTTGSGESSMWSCASQPAQVTVSIFSDAACTMSTTQPFGVSSVKFALDVCNYETEDGGLKGEFRTIVADGIMNVKEYPNLGCTGTAGSDYNITLTACTALSNGGVGPYMQQASAPITAQQAQQQAGTASASAASNSNATNTTAAPKATASEASLPHSMVASLLVAAASAAALKLEF